MKRPSPSLVISCLALFVALSGTSYAVSQLPKNSVGSKQIKKSAVTSAKVKDRSLVARDFKVGQLPAGAQGAQGPQGPQGARGPSASAFAANSATALSTSSTTVISLGTSNDESTGLLTVTTPSRIVFNAAIQLYSGDINQATCSAGVNNGSGWTNINDAIIEQDLATFKDEVTPLTYGFDAEPGTYDIRIACQLDAFTASAYRNRLTAVATAR